MSQSSDLLQAAINSVRVASLDVFDVAMNSKCSLWKKGASGVNDGYGQQSQIFTLLSMQQKDGNGDLQTVDAQDIPCFIKPLTGKELDSEAAYGVAQFLIFMRPVLVDDPPVPLNIHHWLQINKTTDSAGNEVPLIDPPDNTAPMYDLTNINDPGYIGHHLEISAKLIEP